MSVVLWLILLTNLDTSKITTYCFKFLTLNDITLLKNIQIIFHTKNTDKMSLKIVFQFNLSDKKS